MYCSLASGTFCTFRLLRSCRNDRNRRILVPQVLEPGRADRADTGEYGHGRPATAWATSETTSGFATQVIRRAGQSLIAAKFHQDQRPLSGTRRSRQAVLQPLAAGPAVRACISAGTSFAQSPSIVHTSWLDEADVIVAHHLSAVALDLLTSGQRGDKGIDPQMVGLLRAEARRDALLTISAEGSSVAALRALAEHDIPCLVIKGPATARFHPEPGKRTYSDLDVLVSPRRFRAAIDVLVELGYVRKRDAEPLWAAFDRHCVEGFNFHRSPVGNVDLHHHVSPWRFGKNLGFDGLFERSDQGEMAGVPVRFASAEDSLLISCLHVVNDLGKDSPSFNSWRDIAILFDHIRAREFSRSFENAGLGWFETYIRSVLADLGADIDATGPRGLDRGLRCRGERLRLGLMGWNGTSLLARHPLGQVLRLPNIRALFFLLGAAVPSPIYVRGRYPNYRSYWYDALSSMRAAQRGSDFRHERISSISRSAGGSSPSGIKLRH
jgi:Uncharacterised nucleotidyltransferase